MDLLRIDSLPPLPVPDKAHWHHHHSYLHLLDGLSTCETPVTHQLRVLLGRARMSLAGAVYQRRGTLQCILCAIQSKEALTIPHSVRTYALSYALGCAFGLDSPHLAALRAGALLHDIGKLWIPNTALLKADPLSTPEWSQVRNHPIWGGQLVRALGFDPRAAEIVMHHHERIDGSGYPHQLRGSEIPLLARLVAIADCFDAMTSDRPYSRGSTPQDAAAKIISSSGSGFDPDLIHLFASRPINHWLDRAGAVLGP